MLGNREAGALALVGEEGGGNILPNTCINAGREKRKNAQGETEPSCFLGGKKNFGPARLLMRDRSSQEEPELELELELEPALETTAGSKGKSYVALLGHEKPSRMLARA